MLRKVFGYAERVGLDANGRIMLTAAQREYAGLEKRVAVAGVGRNIEIWNDRRWGEEVSDSSD